jgi:hypothetical protein
MKLEEKRDVANMLLGRSEKEFKRVKLMLTMIGNAPDGYYTGTS